MFQCIIQQRNGWIHVPNQEFRDVFPGKDCGEVGWDMTSSLTRTAEKED
jgi:hypothetical protein